VILSVPKTCHFKAVMMKSSLHVTTDSSVSLTVHWHEENSMFATSVRDVGHTIYWNGHDVPCFLSSIVLMARLQWHEEKNISCLRIQTSFREK
jgi:hypothetical protein